MCFSAEGSFTVGAVLLPAGAWCTSRAWATRPGYAPLAVVPVLFGAQQIAEGLVWVGLTRGDEGLVRSASLVFLFFALALWPVWMPLAAGCLEPDRTRRRLWWLIAGLGLGWGAFLYAPILLGPGEYLDVQVVRHSIHYDYARVPLMQLVPALALRALYLATCTFPLMGSSERDARIFGALLAASAVVAQLVFDHAFTSVWCLFAAALAGYLCWALGRATRDGPALVAPGR